MGALRQVAHFMRWRLVPVRYAGKWRRRAPAGASPPLAIRSAPASIIAQQGHCPGPAIAAPQLQRIQEQYRPRVASVVPGVGGHPFKNIFTAADLVPDNPVLQLAFSPAVLGVADDYFGGRLWLDSIQVLYSWPTTTLHESQLWHKDYGDNKTFHWIAYVNDVHTDADGPFVFVDKIATRRIRRSPFIRRIDDATFKRELGGLATHSFTGPAGSSMYVDPAVCYHYGSRCRTGRLAIFVSFNTDRPFVAPVPLVAENRERLAAVARTVRPDLDPALVRRLLQLH